MSFIFQSSDKFPPLPLCPLSSCNCLGRLTGHLRRVCRTTAQSTKGDSLMVLKAKWKTKTKQKYYPELTSQWNDRSQSNYMQSYEQWSWTHCLCLWLTLHFFTTIYWQLCYPKCLSQFTGECAACRAKVRLRKPNGSINLESLTVVWYVCGFGLCCNGCQNGKLKSLWFSSLTMTS